MTVGWLGFDGRVFLTDSEHETYLRRMPVRYARRSLGSSDGMLCAVCGQAATDENRLEASHKVPFGEGIRTYKLTPDWLDSTENLVWAHRIKCNKNAELSKLEIAKLVEGLKSSKPLARQ